MSVELKITKEVEDVTKVISTNIFDMRQVYEEGDIIVGLLMSTILLQQRLGMPFDTLQEMLLRLRLTVDDARGFEKTSS